MKMIKTAKAEVLIIFDLPVGQPEIWYFEGDELYVVNIADNVYTLDLSPEYWKLLGNIKCLTDDDLDLLGLNADEINSLKGINPVAFYKIKNDIKIPIGRRISIPLKKLLLLKKIRFGSGCTFIPEFFNLKLY